ncbi:hypothetical protein CRUP_014130 [Coryphaenoides rupestris]|nr:hypothetical protein CRUP_014130 [Coryphaenoides rupestris]
MLESGSGRISGSRMSSVCFPDDRASALRLLGSHLIRSQCGPVKSSETVELNVALTLQMAENVNLVNGSQRCSGRLEVRHKGQWGKICRNSNWGSREESLVCRELDCGKPDPNAVRSNYGVSTAQKAYTTSCVGSESSIAACQLQLNSGTCEEVAVSCTGQPQLKLINGTDRCSGRVEVQPSRYMGLTGGTNSKQIQLINGTTPCSGRVEVLHEGEWGTACDDSWGLQEAQVVCREMKCGSALAAKNHAYFGQGSGLIVLDDVGCKGHEMSLKECPHAGFPNDCSHLEDAGVICSDCVCQHLPPGSERLRPVGQQPWRLTFRPSNWGNDPSPQWAVIKDPLEEVRRRRRRPSLQERDLGSLFSSRPSRRDTWPKQALPTSPSSASSESPALTSSRHTDTCRRIAGTAPTGCPDTTSSSPSPSAIPCPPAAVAVRGPTPSCKGHGARCHHPEEGGTVRTPAAPVPAPAATAPAIPAQPLCHRGHAPNPRPPHLPLCHPSTTGTLWSSSSSSSSSWHARCSLELSLVPPQNSAGLFVTPVRSAWRPPSPPAPLGGPPSSASLQLQIKADAQPETLSKLYHSRSAHTIRDTLRFNDTVVGLLVKSRWSQELLAVLPFCRAFTLRGREQWFLEHRKVNALQNGSTASSSWDHRDFTSNPTTVSLNLSVSLILQRGGGGRTTERRGRGGGPPCASDRRDKEAGGVLRGDERERQGAAGVPGRGGRRGGGPEGASGGGVAERQVRGPWVRSVAPVAEWLRWDGGGGGGGGGHWGGWRWGNPQRERGSGDQAPERRTSEGGYAALRTVPPSSGWWQRAPWPLQLGVGPLTATAAGGQGIAEGDGEEEVVSGHPVGAVPAILRHVSVCLEEVRAGDSEEAEDGEVGSACFGQVSRRLGRLLKRLPKRRRPSLQERDLGSLFSSRPSRRDTWPKQALPTSPSSASSESPALTSSRHTDTCRRIAGTAPTGCPDTTSSSPSPSAIPCPPAAVAVRGPTPSCKGHGARCHHPEEEGTVRSAAASRPSARPRRHAPAIPAQPLCHRGHAPNPRPPHLPLCHPSTTGTLWSSSSSSSSSWHTRCSLALSLVPPQNSAGLFVTPVRSAWRPPSPPAPLGGPPSSASLQLQIKADAQPGTLSKLYHSRSAHTIRDTLRFNDTVSCVTVLEVNRWPSPRSALTRGSPAPTRPSGAKMDQALRRRGGSARASRTTPVRPWGQPRAPSRLRVRRAVERGRVRARASGSDVGSGGARRRDTGHFVRRLVRVSPVATRVLIRVAVTCFVFVPRVVTCGRSPLTVPTPRDRSGGLHHHAPRGTTTTAVPVPPVRATWRIGCASFTR